MPLALTAPAPAPAPPPIQQTDLDAVLKLIPTEVLAFYTAAVPIVPHAPQTPDSPYPFVLFVVGLVLVPIVLYCDGHTTNQPARWPQYVVRMLAFVAWASAISWPFSLWLDEVHFDWVRSLVVLLVPLIGTLVIRNRPSANPVL